MVYLLVATIILEALLYEPHVWKFARRYLAFGLSIVLPAVAFLAFAYDPSIWAVGLVAASVMRMFNLLRIVADRIKEDHLWRSALRASSAFIVLQGVCIAASILLDDVAIGTVGAILVVIQVLVAWSLIMPARNVICW